MLHECSLDNVHHPFCCGSVIRHCDASDHLARPSAVPLKHFRPTRIVGNCGWSFLHRCHPQAGLPIRSRLVVTSMTKRSRNSERFGGKAWRIGSQRLRETVENTRQRNSPGKCIKAPILIDIVYRTARLKGGPRPSQLNKTFRSVCRLSWTKRSICPSCASSLGRCCRLVPLT